MSASLSFAMQLIAPRLPKYHQRYSQVRVHVETANRYLDIIDNGIDVAIRTREYEPDSTITIRRLASTRRILAASPAYLAQRGRPQFPSDLTDHNVLVYLHANHPNELKFSRGGESQTVNVQGCWSPTTGRYCVLLHLVAWVSSCNLVISSMRISSPDASYPYSVTGICHVCKSTSHIPAESTCQRKSDPSLTSWWMSSRPTSTKESGLVLCDSMYSQGKGQNLLAIFIGGPRQATI